MATKADSYHRRHYGVSKLYAAASKDGKHLGTTFAYTQKEAWSDFRSRGIKPAKVYQT